MKITPEHFDIMQAAINKVVAVHPVSEYRAANPEFSEKRIRWDYWRAAGLLAFTCDTLYKYVNDDHIDTALRAIIRENT